jgi:hypothetical protein
MSKWSVLFFHSIFILSYERNVQFADPHYLHLQVPRQAHLGPGYCSKQDAHLKKCLAEAIVG